MGRPLPPFIRLVGAFLTVLLPVLGVTVPALDAQGMGDDLVLEREHHPGSCPTGHDHTVCTQLGDKLGPAFPSPAPARPDLRQVGTSADTDPVPRPTSLLGPPSRAPPSA